MEKLINKKGLLNRDNTQNIIVIIFFITVMVVFSIGSEYFLTGNNIISIFVAAVPLGLIAIGECTCLMSGFFDLSPGMVASLASVIWVTLIMQAGFDTWVAFIIALLFGIGSGAIAGFATAYLRIPAWISTYALLQLWQGVSLLITNAEAVAMTNHNEFKVLGQTKVIGDVPLPVIILIAAYVLMFIIYRYTKLGRSFYIIGGNVEAAKNVGIRVKRTQFFCFVLSGLLAALGGMLFASRSSSVQPIIGEMYALQAIAATVVGGTAMSGGRANIALTFVGVLIIVAMQNGMSMINVPTYYQFIVTGVILFIAVLIQTDRKNSNLG